MFNIDDAATVYVWKEYIIPIIALLVFMIYVISTDIVECYKCKKAKKEYLDANPGHTFKEYNYWDRFTNKNKVQTRSTQTDKIICFRWCK